MLNRSTSILATLLLIALPAVAAPGEDSGLVTRFQMPAVLEGDLDNGLHVVVCPRPGSGLVDVRIALRVGTWLEGEYLGSGISHYFEHLVGGGSTSSRTEQESQALLRSIGAIKNARTDVDRSWFYVTTTPDGFERATDLLADWLVRGTLPQDEIDRERNVILRELDLYRDFDPRRAWELLHATAFNRHPARLPLQGFREPFERLSRDDLVKFRAMHYVPANAVVAVVGDVDGEAAYETVRRCFSSWQAAPRPKLRVAAEVPQGGRRSARLDGVGSLDSVALGYRTVPLDHADMIYLDVLKEVVGTGRDSRLYRRAVDELGLASEIRVLSRTPALGGGLFAVLAQVPPNRVERFEAVVQEEFSRIARDGITEQELQRAGRTMHSDLVFGLQWVDNLSQTLTRDFLASGDCRYSETYLDLLRDVTVDDVRRAAARYLVPERLTVAVVGPRRQAPGEGASDSGEASAAPVLESYRLENGVQVRLLPEPGSGVLAVHACFVAGSAVEDGSTSGASSMLAELLLKGGRQTISDGLRQIELQGGAVMSAADRFSVGFTVEVLPDDLDLAIRFLGQTVVDLSFDPDEFDRARTRALARAASREADFDGNAQDLLFAELFAGSGYARSPAGDRESLESLDRARMESFAKRVVAGENMVVAVVGDFDPDGVRARLEEALGGLSAGTRLSVQAPQPVVESTDQPIFHESDRSQATVILAWPASPIEEVEERTALDLIDAWFSGTRFPSGPLLDALRVERDLVYFAHALNEPLPGAGLFYIHVQCDPDRYLEVVETVRRTVTERLSGGIQEEDLATARNILLAGRQTVTQTAAARAFLLALAELQGLPPDSEDRYRDCMTRTGLDRVNECAGRLFRGKPLLLVVWPKGVPRP